MRIEDIRYDFEQMEKPFWNLQIRGIPFWHLIRMAFYEMIMENIPGMGAPHPDQKRKLSLIKKGKLAIRLCLGSIIQHPMFQFQKGKDFLIINVPGQTKYKGKYICTMIETELEILDGKYNYLERSLFNEKRSSPERTCIAYSDYMEIKRFWNYLCKRYFLNAQERLMVDDIIIAVEQIFSIKLQPQQVYARINHNLTGYFTYYRAYQKLFKKYKPRFILETTHYEIAKMSLNKLAHEHNIKVYELQHGVMNLQYEVPFVDAYMPDELLTFGDYWNHFTGYPGKMTAVGNPHLEECVQEMKLEAKVPTILILSAGPVAKTLVQLALDMEQYCIKHNIHLRILYKMHPNEYQTWRELHPQLQNSSIEVIDNNEHDLYYYFSISTHQLGVSSTALYEGLAFHLKTIIYKAYRHDMMSDLINSGYAKLASSLEDVMNLITEPISTEMDINDFWKQGAKENLQKILTSDQTDGKTKKG